MAVLLAALCVPAAVWAREPIPMKWKVEGSWRDALIFSPTSGSGKAPVIFGFHGHGGNMRFAARGMHFQDAWPEAIVVYMQGLPTPSLFPERESGFRSGWQHDPGELHDRDLKFVDAVLVTLHQKFSIDDNRIYATGFSNGGFFTYLLWAERPSVFAAFAPGAATVLPSFHLSQPHAAFCYGGQQDHLVNFVNQQQTIDEIRELDHCAPSPENCGIDCELYASNLGTPVETFIHPGGHVYPPPVTPLIVKFFQDHPRRS